MFTHGTKLSRHVIIGIRFIVCACGTSPAAGCLPWGVVFGNESDQLNCGPGNISVATPNVAVLVFLSYETTLMADVRV